jgi:Xaa-Pro aminopeptidase
MRYEPIDKQLFVENRRRFTAAMKPNSIAVFLSSDEMPKSADANYDFRQNPDLFYLSGIDQEKCALILYPDAPEAKLREILFVRKTSEHIQIWEGHKVDKKEAREISGVQNIQWEDQFSTMLAMLMNRAEGAYLNMNEHDRAANEAPYRDLRFAKQLREQYPLHQLHRAAPILKDLRSIKSPIEVGIMRHAAKLTGDAFHHICDFVKPGVWEFEIEAEITREFVRNRSRGHAYTPIIASGANACILHYIDNNMQCQDGDLLLMDFGAEYGNYCADLTRTIPVNGRFTDRQRAVYNSVLRVMQEATSMLQPGTRLDIYQKEVGKLMESELIDLGLLDKAEVQKQNPDAPLYRKYFMHGTSHYLGLDVHDVGDRYAEIKPGMVFTVEPGIYIREEGIGIRLENDVLVTQDGIVDFMDGVALEADAVEDAMNATVRG